MPKRSLMLALVLALPTTAPLAAQSGNGSSNAVIASMKGLHDITTGFISATAEKVPENLYSYRPTEEVRTLGQILAHIAGAQFSFCSAAAGEASPSSEHFEETRTTKAEIIEALRAGFAYCDGVYDAMTDEEGAAMVSFFGNQMAATATLAFNSAHNYEHYGNLVTYMRINGIVPPSSS